MQICIDNLDRPVAKTVAGLLYIWVTRALLRQRAEVRCSKIGQVIVDQNYRSVGYQLTSVFVGSTYSTKRLSSYEALLSFWPERRVRAARCLDKYFALRQAHDSDTKPVIDVRLEAIVERMIQRCCDDQQFQQVCEPKTSDFVFIIELNVIWDTLIQ